MPTNIGDSPFCRFSRPDLQKGLSPMLVSQEGPAKGTVPNAGFYNRVRPTAVSWYFWPFFMMYPAAASEASSRDHVGPE